jgi:hypothetical protein
VRHVPLAELSGFILRGKSFFGMHYADKTLQSCLCRRRLESRAVECAAECNMARSYPVACCAIPAGGCSSDDDTTWIQPMQWWDTATILRRNECSDCGQISPLHGLAHASLHSSVASPNMRAIWIDLWNPLYHRTATHPATSRFRAVSNCGRRLCDLTVQSV